MSSLSCFILSDVLNRRSKRCTKHWCSHSDSSCPISGPRLIILQALPFAPYLSDGIGRRKALCIGSVVMVGGVALQSTATHVVQLILARGTSKYFHSFKSFPI